MGRTVELVIIVLFLYICAPQRGSTARSSSVENVIENCPSLRELVLERLENFRHGMPCGFPVLRIPVLAPFRWERLAVDTGDSFWLRFDGVFQNGTTLGFDRFNVTGLQIQPAKLQMDFEALFPAIETVGKYNAKGKLVGFIPFQRSGSVFLQLNALTIRGSVWFTIDRNRFLVRHMKMFPSVRSAVARFEKIMLLPWTNSLFEQAISDFIPNYLRENADSIAGKIEANLKPRMNAVLLKYDIRDFMGKITPKDFQFPSCP